ncbi:sugar (and other) transporter family protein [Lyngbya aestuarii BL J]|uniref:Sugar (And other) transporter family protein n=1 Tax=Lyngbya aestuarii BL J TaxID=1348334 RepID=U7QJI3_9CYAN|nr:MFS transporter [Lyngbya aestuarii]ERT07402.1 sugar (and other) transporter family protein [Lyngbya aestuarii BL J]
MNVFSTLEPKRRRSLLLLFIAGLCFWSSTSSLLPTLPLYIQALGGTNQQVGLVMGAFAIGLLPSRFGLGPLADAKSRKLVLFIGTTAVMFAPLGYLLATSIPTMAVIRAFHGISIAAFTIGYSALVADISPVNRRGEVIGYMSLVTPVGMAIGPAFGGFVQAWMGYKFLFLSAATFGLLAGLGISQVWEPTRPKPPLENMAFTPSTPKLRLNKLFHYFKLMGSPPLRTPAFVMAIVGLIFGSLVSFLPLYIAASNLELNAGLFYSTAAIASFSSRIFVGRASDRYGRGIFITIALVFYLVSMLLLGTADNIPEILFAAAIEGSAAGILIPTVITLVTDRCSPDERGRFFSLCVGGFDIGIALAGPLFGWVAEQVGYSNMYLLDAGLALLGLIIFITQSSRNIPDSIKFALGKAEDIYIFKS